MPDDVVLRPQGRVSEPSPDAAPAGSLLVAENVVIRETGIVRHLGNSTVISTGTSNTIWNISPQFDNGTTPGQLLYSGNANGSSSGVAMSGAAGTEIQYDDVDGTATRIQYFDHGEGESMPPMYIARDNMYLSDQRGVYKLQSNDATSLDRVWDSQAVAGTASLGGTGSWLGTNEHVNYTYVLLFEDTNGVIRRSAPNIKVTLENLSTANGGLIRCWIPVDANNDPAFVGVEVYRTRNFANTVTPPEEYFLAVTIPQSLFDTTVGDSIYNNTLVVDAVAEAALSAALYTSGSQGGIEAANIAPPEHLYHAAFKGHEFWGNVSEKEFFPVLKSTQSVNTDHYHDLTGTSYTSGVNSITETVSLDGLEVGMLITTSSVFPRGTYVTAISGSGPWTITTSQNATATGSSNIRGIDTIYVLWGDGSTSRANVTSLNTMSFEPDQPLLEAAAVGGTEYGDVDSPYLFAHAYSSRHRCARQGVAQAWVSNPDLFEAVFDWADLNTGSGAPTTGGTEARQALHLARIYWSKFQEPEHTTLGNFQDVGNASGIGGGQIVGLGALKEALIIVKTDGIFRLTGDRGNWRIDPLDTSIRMIGGRTVQVMDNTVYALSERGVVRITAGGVQELTDGIVGDWFGEAGIGTHRAGDIREYMLENDGYHPPLLQATVDTTNREYVLMAEGPGSSNGDDAELLVYNAKTGSFVTWELYTDSQGIAAIGYARGDYSSSSEQYPGVVFSRGVGEGNGELRLIQNQRGVSGSDFPVEIRFRARSGGDPTHVKLWTDSVWQMVAGGAARTDVDCLFRPSEDGNTDAVAVATDDGTRQIRCWVPRSSARSDELVAGISGTNVSIRGVRLSFRSSGRRPPVSND